MHFDNDIELYRMIGANIKHYRQQAKLTQVQFAEQAKISVSYLSKVEAAGCDKSLSISVLNQIAMRENLIQTFLHEKPGTGTGDNASRYRYNVERFYEYGIFLKRPTQLNKGFDFTVNIDGLFFKKNRRYSNPSHQDIIDALTNCKVNFPHIYPTIALKLRQIYSCEPVSLTPSIATFYDYTGESHPVEIILLAVKWLFMEQDCAYWNYSGRAMFYNVLQKNGLI